MARVNNLTNFLNDVATAIKQKLGDNTPIPASQFDTKIGEIETGGNYQTKSISITTNGNYTQLPDTGYDAMDQVSITVNVPSQQPNLQTKSIVENGTYTPDTGYDGFSEVDVDVPFPIKLFENKTLMDADENKSIGDKAVVYGDEQSEWNGDTVSSVIILKNVTLPAELTTSISQRTWDMSSNGRIALTPTSCTITYRGSNWRTKTITYTSEDGIHYVGDTDDTIFTPSQGYIRPSGVLPDECLCFFNVTQKAFNGLFECHEIDDISRITCIDPNNIVITSSGITTSTHTINISDILSKIVAKHKSEGLGTLSDMLIAITGRDGDTITEVTYYKGSSYAYYSNSQWLYQTSTTSEVIPQTFYKYNIANDTFETIIQAPTLVLTSGSYKHYVGYNVGLNDIFYVYHNYTYDTFSTQGNVYYYGYANNTYYYLSGKDTFPTILKYEYISTQLSDILPDEIIDGTIVYGKNGVVKSNGQIWNKTPAVKYLEKMYGMSFVGGLYGQSTHYTWPNIERTEFISMPEENVKIQYIKDTYVGTNTKVRGYMPIEQSYYNRYSPDLIYNVVYNNGVYTITNTNTEDTWEYTPSETGYNYYVTNTKMYLYKDSSITFGKSFSCTIIVYNLLTKSVETQNTSTIEFSNTVSTSSGLSGITSICPALDLFMIGHYSYGSSGKYYGGVYGGKLSTIGTTGINLLYDGSGTGFYGPLDIIPSTDGNGLISVQTDVTSWTLYEYDLSTGNKIKTYSNTKSLIGNVAVKSEGYMYIAGNNENYRFDISAGSYTIIDYDIPTVVNPYNGALSSKETISTGTLVKVFSTFSTIDFSFIQSIGHIYNNSDGTRYYYASDIDNYYNMDNNIITTITSDGTIYKYKPYILTSYADYTSMLLPAACKDTTFFDMYKEVNETSNNEE